MLLLSHNDEWTKNPIIDAVKAGCDIIEVDVVYSHGKVWASHSTRFFKFLYRGTFKEMYLDKWPKGKVLYIDIKQDTLTLAMAVLNNLVNANFKETIIVGGKENATKVIINAYGLDLKIFDFAQWTKDKEVKSVDVFGKKRWCMK